MEGLSSKIIKSLYIPLPPTKEEQDVISSVLSDTDDLISLLNIAVTKKRSIKTATMQRLLSGTKRLPGFKGRWEKTKLGDLLAYEQPTQYLVRSTEYSDSYDTPVLTAGKTFILGYTNETEGIFTDVPVIIFDDFTTANKYVTSPFKAKSSAMKMLRPRHKEINLRFVFEKMQLIDFKLGDHKRYWISEYQNIELEMPEPNEQAAIATVLSDMDDEITKLETRLQKTRELKEGMMQKLLIGSIRLV
jgi:type I restriction enzyme S subunit